MAKNNNLTDFLTDVANTIRAKKGTSEPLDPQDFSDEIATISTSKPEGPANVTPTTSAQTIYPSEGEAFNVVNVSAVTSAIDDNIRASNIKAGVSILGVSGTLPTATLYSTSTILTNPTQTFTPDPGYDGFSAITLTAPLTSSTVSPSTTAKTITPAGTGCLGFSVVNVGAVTSAIDSNIKASNIKSGISILGVSGTLTAATLYSSSVTLNYSTQTFTPTPGYDGFSKITITAPLEERTFTPSTAFKTYTSPSTLGFGIVNINAVTSAIDSNIQASNIKKDVTILGVTGTLESGGGSGHDKELVEGTISEFIDTNGISFIRNNFFENCTQLSSISFPSCVSIGSYAFRSCSALSGLVQFPLCTTVGDGAFQSCGSLAANFPECTQLGNAAFQNAKVWDAYFPKITTIPISCFNNCWSLTQLNFPSCTTIGAYAFNYIPAAILSFSLCTSLGSEVFGHCQAKEVNLPLITKLPSGTFSWCSQLERVSLPTCSSFGTRCFQNCYSLSSIRLPSACTYIGDFAFLQCSRLTDVWLTDVSKVPTLGNNAFMYTPITGSTAETGISGSVYVPTSLYNSFIVSTNWSLISSRIVSV